MKRTDTPGHIDFALAGHEIKRCVLCGEVPQDGQWWSDYRVTPEIPHPIRGSVGVCLKCSRWDEDDNLADKVLVTWRRTALSFIPIVPHTPIQLAVRGCCNDVALASVIRDTLVRVPLRCRQRVMDYVLADGHCSTTGKGMRFEALGRWPGMGTAAGMNMDNGHAIRLRASFVRKADMPDLSGTIAHELAHTEQKAEGLTFDSDDECERDVEERLKFWGFDDGSTEDGTRALLDTFDAIIRLAKKGKTAIRNARSPSGNYAADAIREAEKAESAVVRASERWKGR